MTLSKYNSQTLQFTKVQEKNKHLCSCVSPLLLHYYHTHKIFDTRCIGCFFFPHTKQFSVTPAGCPTIQFNSILTLTRLSSDPMILPPSSDTNYK